MIAFSFTVRQSSSLVELKRYRWSLQVRSFGKGAYGFHQMHCTGRRVYLLNSTRTRLRCLSSPSPLLHADSRLKQQKRVNRSQDPVNRKMYMILGLESEAPCTGCQNAAVLPVDFRNAGVLNPSERSTAISTDARSQAPLLERPSLGWGIEWRLVYHGHFPRTYSLKETRLLSLHAFMFLRKNVFS
jgi:hypothetical protein